MKICIIGAGHIGSAIAACLAQGHLYNESDIIVANPHVDKLMSLQQNFPSIHVTTNNQSGVKEADIIILAINPSKIDDTLSSLRFSRSQILVSLASGVSITYLARYVNSDVPLFRVIPSMAFTEHSSLTLIASRGATETQQQLIKHTFEEGGKCLLLSESLLDIASALTSSGVAFALKFIQAAMQAGIELGISPKDAMQMIAYSLEGAADLVLNHDTHPCLEIEKIATPGGVTIQGLNELEYNKFSAAIIKAIKVSANTFTNKGNNEL